LVEDGTIKEHTIIKVTDHMTNGINGRKIMIVLGCEIIGQPSTGKIGQPKRFDPNATPAAPVAVPQANAPAPGQSYSATPKVSRGPSVSRSPDMGCTPIMQINPYANRWKIKGRITDITKMKTWSNARGDGKLMSVTILDKHGDDIKGTFFNDTAAKYHPDDPGCTQRLEKGGMYTFTGGRVKVANAKWNSCRSEYEISFNNNCEIVQVQDDGGVQKVSYDRCMIDRIENMEPGARSVDILGVVMDFQAHSTFTSKKGNEVTKRELTVADESGASIRATLWGDLAFTPDASFENNPIVLITKCKISDYGGRTLSSAFSGSALEFNPDFAPEMSDVQGWHASGGSNNVKGLSTSGGGTGAKDSIERRKRLVDIDDENIGEDAEKANFINVKAYVTFVKTDGNWCYPADPETRKKLTEDQSAGTNGMWRNEGTGAEYEKPDWSYCVNMKIEDYTGVKYAMAFNKDTQAKAFYNGVTANELKKMEEDADGDTTESHKLLESIHFKQYKLVLMVSTSTHEDEPRKGCKIFKVEEINYVDECQKLLEAIDLYDQ